jgi:hypothetical protein
LYEISIFTSPVTPELVQVMDCVEPAFQNSPPLGESTWREGETAEVRATAADGPDAGGYGEKSKRSNIEPAS